MLRSMSNTFLALLLFITLFLSLLPFKANAAFECQIGISSGSVSWPGNTFGDKPYTCVRTCRYNLATVAVCFVNNGTCHGEFISNGNNCLNGAGQIDGSDGLRFGGNTVIPDPSADPQKPWDPNSPSTMPAKIQNVINSMPNDTSTGRTQADAYKKMGFIEGLGVMTLDEILIKNSQLLDLNKGYSSLMSNIERHTDKAGQFTQMSANTLGKILTKLNEIGSGGGSGSGLSDSQYNGFMTSMATTRSVINANSDNIVRAVRDVQQTISPLEFGLFDINENTRLVNQNLASLSEGLFLTMQENTDKIVSAINSNGGGSGGGNTDLSGVQSGIDSIKTGIDNLNGLLRGTGLDKPSVGSGVDFSGLPLYGDHAITKLNTEITDLQKQYSEKTKEFQKLFSFDITKLETGKYQDHSLTFKFANGVTTKFTSGVFPALVDNAALISTVILFLAAFAGIRTIMGGRE
ncbi:hypothetical protein B7953_14995 [Vibrio paracholerae]|uniref:hypothetical protein n=1 Tax=Vibrio paracholerae TaxID=650003 RepID=UPI000A0F6614|nr:hypothetical protein [Vibrio paracholerae]ORP19384.1 hypothetical protein B7953_14995 [Vibrio paracholerae]